MSLQDLQKAVRDAGFKNFFSADWENEVHIYAFSVESYGPGSYGHPKFTAHFNKMTGYLSLTGKSAVKLESSNA